MNLGESLVEYKLFHVPRNGSVGLGALGSPYMTMEGARALIKAYTSDIRYKSTDFEIRRITTERVA